MIGTGRERERFAGIFRDFRFEFFPQKKKKKKISMENEIINY